MSAHPSITFQPFAAVPLTEPPRILTALEFDDLRKRIADAQGDIAKAGVSAIDIRNMVWTQRNLEKPIKVEATTGEAKPKAKAKKEKVTLAGLDLDTLLSGDSQ